MSGVVASCTAIAAGAADFTLSIASNVRAPDLRALALAAGWDGAGKLTVAVTAAYVSALSVPAVGVAAFPGGLQINIAAGKIVGAENSGYALTVAQAVTIDNLGAIAGMGGKGGDGGWAQTGPTDGSVRAYGGTGGQGQYLSGSPPVLTGPQSGSAGQTVYGTLPSPQYSATGGTGGTGGTLGHGGDGGGFGYTNSPGGSVQPTSNPGGNPGACIGGNSYITWINAGTRLGAIT